MKGPRVGRQAPRENPVGKATAAHESVITVDIPRVGEFQLLTEFPPVIEARLIYIPGEIQVRKNIRTD